MSNRKPDLNKTRFASETDALRDFNRGVVEEFRAQGGRVGGPLAGGTHLLLHSTGAKSGKPRLSPLAYLTIDGQMIITGAYAGATVDPAWAHNLRAHPKSRIEIGTEAFDVDAREILPPERDTLYAKVAELSTEFTTFQEAAAPRPIPLFELRRAH